MTIEGRFTNNQEFSVKTGKMGTYQTEDELVLLFDYTNEDPPCAISKVLNKDRKKPYITYLEPGIYTGSNIQSSIIAQLNVLEEN